MFRGYKLQVHPATNNHTNGHLQRCIIRAWNLEIARPARTAISVIVSVILKCVCAAVQDKPLNGIFLSIDIIACSIYCLLNMYNVF